MGLGFFDQELGGFGLELGMVSPSFSGIDLLRLGMNHREDGGANEGIVNHDIGVLELFFAPESH
jgi:hypothetical protein